MDTVELNLYTAEIDRLCRGADASGATGTAALLSTGRIRTPSVHTGHGGTDYSVGDVLTISNATFTVTTVDAGVVTGVSLTTPGSGFAANGNDVATTVAPAGGTGCKLDYIVEKGINTITKNTGGTGYVGATVVFTGGSGTGAEAHVTIDSGAVDTIEVDTPGWYLTAPSVTIVASAPSTGNFQTALEAFDLTRRESRLLTALGEADKVVVGSMYSGGAIQAVIDAYNA